MTISGARNDTLYWEEEGGVLGLMSRGDRDRAFNRKEAWLKPQLASTPEWCSWQDIVGVGKEWD